MSEKMYPGRVTRGDDGVYRWSYDMDMYHNHYFRNLLLKIVGIICAGLFVLMVGLFAMEGMMSPLMAGITLLILVGIVLLTLLFYYLAAVIMHGVYHLRFEMNDDAVMLIRKASTTNMMNSMAMITMLTSAAAGKPMRGVASGASMSAAASSGLTWFKHVKGMKEYPQYDAVSLRSTDGPNQIWIPKEDFIFVKDFIKSRMSMKK